MKTDSVTDSVDLLADGFSTRGVRLSSAAGMSARFTYASPPGSLLRPMRNPVRTTRAVKIRVVDGGYFENSGAATLMDLLSAVRGQHPDPLPILILIRNDPQGQSVCRRSSRRDPRMLGEDLEMPHSGDLLDEVAAPVRALLNSRSARGRLAEVDAARTVEELGGAVIEILLAAVVQAKIEAASEASKDVQTRKQEEQELIRRLVEPPLGWSLSKEVRKTMDHVLDKRRGGLRREPDTLAALLRGELDPARARCGVR